MAKRLDVIIGFADDEGLVRAVARRMRVRAAIAGSDRYPSGELKVTVPVVSARTALVVGDAANDPDRILRLAILGEGCRANGMRADLLAPWIAYGRQDRAAKPGESPGGLSVARMLAGVFGTIVTLDAHSAAFIRAFRGALRNVVPFSSKKILSFRGVTLVAAPDHGARDRARGAAKVLRVPFTVIAKRHTPTGVVSQLDIREKLILGAHVLIIDDMTDTGRTLDAASCVLRTAGASRVSALVTHAADLGTLRRRLKNIDRLAAVYDRSTRIPSSAALDAMIGKLR